MTYSEASSSCDSIGGKLVVFNSFDEMTALGNAMANTDAYYDYFWVGCTDQAVEGTFICEDGTQLALDSGKFTHQKICKHRKQPCYNVLFVSLLFCSLLCILVVLLLIKFTFGASLHILKLEKVKYSHNRNMLKHVLHRKLLHLLVTIQGQSNLLY